MIPIDFLGHASESILAGHQRGISTHLQVKNCKKIEHLTRNQSTRTALAIAEKPEKPSAFRKGGKNQKPTKMQ